MCLCLANGTLLSPDPGKQIQRGHVGRIGRKQIRQEFF
jgi:hypothetical protein